MMLRALAGAALLCLAGGTAAGLAAGLWEAARLHYLAHGLWHLATEQVLRHVATSVPAVASLLFTIAGTSAAIVALLRSREAAARVARRWARLLGTIVLFGLALQWARDVWMPTMGETEHVLGLALLLTGTLTALGALFAELSVRTLLAVRLTKTARAAACFVGVLWCVLGAAATHERLLRDVSGPNVLLVVVDCLRADHLGVYGYERDTSPTLDALARSGLRYTNTRSAAPWTKAAIATLLTGRYPYGNGVVNLIHVLPPSALTLTELLEDEGYDSFFVSGPNGWLEAAFGIPQGFDLQVSGQLGDDLVSSFDHWLGEGRDRPFFAYLHFMDAHVPYHLNEFSSLWVEELPEDPSLLPPSVHLDGSGGDGFSVDDLRKRTAAGTLTAENRALTVDYYDAQIRYVDDRIRRVLERLSALGQLDETVVVVTADHGEEFWEHGSYGHGHTLYDELLHVPLVIAGPGVPRGLVESPTSLVDLLPTLLAVLGSSRVAPQADGQVMLPASPVPERGIHAMATVYGTERRALIRDGRKLILTGEDSRDRFTMYGPTPTEPIELYDLVADPGETRNLTVEDPTTTEALRTELDARLPGAREGTGIELDDELRQRLEAIGYGH